VSIGVRLVVFGEEKTTLALKETVLGREHLDTLTSVNNLAQMLERQGKCKDAEAMNRQTLALYQTVLGREHPETLTSMSNLAGVLESQDKYEDAEAMNRQTLALRETVLGRKHSETLTSMYNLAHLFAKLRYCTVPGKDHPTTCACHQDYAGAQRKSRKARHTVRNSSVSADKRKP
jgi:hypothetical protein